jgi:hypothetical protein
MGEGLSTERSRFDLTRRLAGFTWIYCLSSTAYDSESITIDILMSRVFKPWVALRKYASDNCL